jgi:hypothetical protein
MSASRFSGHRKLINFAIVSYDRLMFRITTIIRQNIRQLVLHYKTSVRRFPPIRLSGNQTAIALGGAKSETDKEMLILWGCSKEIFLDSFSIVG